MIRGNTSPTSDPGESAVCQVGDLSFRARRDNVRPLKPHTSAAEQLRLLRHRGLLIDDEHQAREGIRRLGYYRLSGYGYPLKRPDAASGDRSEMFRDGATFELLLALAEFDKTLRLLLLQGLETIEVAVRAAVADRLGSLDAEGHRNPSLLDRNFTMPQGGLSPHDVWLQRFDELCARSKEEFVEHHRRNYGGRMPVWVAAEVWDFGLLSRLVTGLHHRDQIAIARQFGINERSVLKSWMHAFNFTRNVAAHHGRLWNRANPKVPMLPSVEACPELAFLRRHAHSRTRLFGTLCCMRVVIRAAMPRSNWHAQIKAHLATFPDSPLVSPAFAGFLGGWEDLSLWRA